MRKIWALKRPSVRFNNHERLSRMYRDAWLVEWDTWRLGRALFQLNTDYVQVSPRFSSACGGNGADHTTEGVADSTGRVRESRSTVPWRSYRTRGLQLRIYSTLGQRCVWNGVRSPEGMQASRTRTSSFSNSTVWWPGAATTAARESGHFDSFWCSTEESGWTGSAIGCSSCRNFLT